jgi:CO/xanthine dehydrogenase FAD-binding subunit
VDLATVTEFAPASGTPWREGDAYLAGGTWLLSEPQPGTTRLLDLSTYNWPPLIEADDGLEIAATCTLAELARWRPAPHHDWPAATILLRTCCDSLLGSFKVQNVATVGGNICLSLPAGPMIALAAALDGVATVLSPAGAARAVPVTDFVVGERRSVLRPGELLRSVFLPAAALGLRAACHQVSLAPLGRTAVLLIGTVDQDQVLLTLTAAVPRPVRIRLPLSSTPNEAASSLTAAVAAAQATSGGGGPGGAGTGAGYLDDVHGSALWRRAMTERAVREVLAELAGAGPSGRGRPG